MGTSAGRVLVAAAACLFWLTGCESSTQLGDLSKSDTPPASSSSQDSASPQGSPSDEDPSSTGSVQPAARDAATGAGAKKSAGKDPEDLRLGKKYFNAGNFSLAERHFRRAVELRPRDLEGWVGLAASYDRLRRYDLADRAYKEALAIYGSRPEVLNNIGYSFLLRGDLRKARQKFAEAQAKDPENPTIANNIALVDAAVRRRKGLN